MLLQHVYSRSRHTELSNDFLLRFILQLRLLSQSGIGYFRSTQTILQDLSSLTCRFKSIFQLIPLALKCVELPKQVRGLRVQQLLLPLLGVDLLAKFLRARLGNVKTLTQGLLPLFGRCQSVCEVSVVPQDALAVLLYATPPLLPCRHLVLQGGELPELLYLSSTVVVLLQIGRHGVIEAQRRLRCLAQLASPALQIGRRRRPQLNSAELSLTEARHLTASLSHR
mmetsp:Transcript_41069/g.89735  ORF Transcript_41069/g.89735 Transcript_41069/m.89735 type:complete len:225 (-) Transcript_41069:481-1155(-)